MSENQISVLTPQAPSSQAPAREAGRLQEKRGSSVAMRPECVFGDIIPPLEEPSAAPDFVAILDRFDPSFLTDRELATITARSRKSTGSLPTPEERVTQARRVAAWYRKELVRIAKNYLDARAAGRRTAAAGYAKARKSLISALLSRAVVCLYEKELDEFNEKVRLESLRGAAAPPDAADAAGTDSCAAAISGAGASSGDDSVHERGRERLPHTSGGKHACRDHEDRVFESCAAMCRAYGVPVSTYTARLKNGWSLEEALTGKKVSAGMLRDHLGNRYSSEAQMCRAYGISPCVYRSRINAGWTMEDALTRPVRKAAGTKKVYYDHLGNRYSSVCEMCDHYGITTQRYYDRRRAGWSVEEALTRPAGDRKRGGKPALDHLGSCYPSVRKMCDHYGITTQRYYNRRKAGWSLEEALTKNAYERKYKGNPVCDHLGSRYRSLTEMCRHYHLRVSTYRERINLGWTVEDALTKPVRKAGDVEKAVYDHLGNRYGSVCEMCDHYGITPQRYYSRKKAGWSLEEVLTQPADDGRFKGIPVCDHLGSRYPSLAEMCRHYHIPVSTYKGRKKKGWPLRDILTEPAHMTVCDHAGNYYPTISEMCAHYHVTPAVFRKRRREGWSLEEALTGRQGSGQQEGAASCRASKAVQP